MKESLDFIYKEQKELSTFGGIAALLGWDQMTYMPQMGAIDRSEHSSLISRLSHEKVVSDKLWNHIGNLTKSENFEKLNLKDKTVVSRLKKDVEKARMVPSNFVERMVKTTTLAYPAWQEAREKSEFKIFLPHLEKIVELEKEYCELIKLPGPRYNSLLDDYEEGMTVDRIKEEFSYLKIQIVKILDNIKSSNIFKNQKEIELKFPIENQKNLCNIVTDTLLLNKDKTRIDVSTHPFTTSMGYNDVRITTNFERKNPLFSFFSTVHEAGHALYELGIPKDEFLYTVVSDSPSLGLHESQSRFWENMICRSKYFWNYFYPIFKDNSSSQLKDLDINSWYRYVNLVKPSYIRVEADELTYCLHVILRFELENSLMNDKIEVSELPELWNNKMDELLGITPKNDKEGVLQDMHWSGGSFGYFPTYAIGSIYSSQIFKSLANENPNVLSDIEKGNFNNILGWLRKNVHKYGRKITSDEIIKNVCGEGLNAKVFVNYLKDKYYKLYDI
jgi:carboxypeptidase Taq